MENQNQDPHPEILTEADDIAHNKFFAAASYVGIFVLVPILLAKESRFAQFHANQGAILLIATIIINGVGPILPVIGSGLIVPLGNLAAVVLSLIGIVNAVQGKEQELPLIGKFKIV